MKLCSHLASEAIHKHIRIQIWRRSVSLRLPSFLLSLCSSLWSRTTPEKTCKPCTNPLPFHLVNLTQIHVSPFAQPRDRLWIEATWRPLTCSLLARRRRTGEAILGKLITPNSRRLSVSSKTDLFSVCSLLRIAPLGSSFITSLKSSDLKIVIVLRKHKSPAFERNIVFKKNAVRGGLNVGNLRKMLPQTGLQLGGSFSFRHIDRRERTTEIS